MCGRTTGCSSPGWCCRASWPCSLAAAYRTSTAPPVAPRQRDMRRRVRLLRPHRLSRRHHLHPEYRHHWSRVSPDGWPPNEDADIISDGKHEALQLSGGQYDRYLDVASRSSIRCGAVDQHLRSGKFTHGKYWALDVEGKHITALRKAVNLLDDPSADLTQYEATA